MGRYAKVKPDARRELIVRYIQDGTAVTAEILAEKLGVDKKTIHRDITDIREMEGTRIEWDPKERAYHVLDPVYKFSKAFLKGEDAVTSLLIACAVLRDFRNTPLFAEVEKLTRILTENLPPKTAKYELTPRKYSYVHTQMAGVDPTIWKVVVHGLNYNHRLQITYRAPHRSPTKREIIPLHLHGYKGGWYIIAYCTLRDQELTFNMSRVLDAEDTGEEFSPAAYPFDIEQYFPFTSQIIHGVDPTPCTVKFTAMVADRVREVTYYDSQKCTTNEDGSVTMTFNATDLFSATRFILEWGGEARAVKPRELVESVRKAIATLAKAHRLTMR